MSEEYGRRSRRRNYYDGKQPASVVSSSVSDEEEEEGEEEEEVEEEVEVIEISSSSDVETDIDWQETSGSSGGGGESSDEDFVVEDADEEEEKKGGDVASLSECVSRLLLPEKRSAKGTSLKLKLVECKAYLRKHGLRVGGTKVVCLERVNEHLRIKDGNGQRIYPRSSFLINCTGDVCKGDVVLFKQKVYDSFDKASRQGRVLGKRTIAGRVVKESYGSAKQQHTFTVEVLWSTGKKRLPPLFPLLVKGRNLYKMRTFRQAWENEEERKKVLDEKHKRGSEARRIRAIRISKLDPEKGGRRRAKASQLKRQPQKNRAVEPEQGRPFLEHQRPCVKETSGLETSRNFHCRETIPSNLQSYARDDYPQRYHGQKSAKASQPARQPQKNAAAEPEQRRPFLEHPRPYVNGTSGLETSRNFQCLEDIHQNLQSYGRDDYPQRYHGMTSQSANNFQRTTSATMPRPHKEYYGGPPLLPPASNGQFFRHTNDVRYNSFNPRNTRDIPEQTNYQMSRVCHPTEAYDPRAERRYGQYEYDPREERRYGRYEYEDRADRRGY